MLCQTLNCNKVKKKKKYLKSTDELPNMVYWVISLKFNDFVLLNYFYSFITEK